MEDNVTISLNWTFDFWEAGIEKFYPINGKYFPARVTGVTPEQAWLVTENGIECYLRKERVSGTNFQIQDLRDELKSGQTVETKVIGYNHTPSKPQLRVAIRLNN